MSLLRHRQIGQALWLLLCIVLLVSSYAAYEASWWVAGQTGREIKLANSLAKAKEALLARAVADMNRPGSLPCPDLITDSLALNNTPGDGRADMLAGNHCPSYVGWLPWTTLDLPELVDNEGNHLWYALSSSLRDDDSAQPINSDIAMTLSVDSSDDIAAIIIAPQAPLSGQNRPSNSPLDYLDRGNGQNSNYSSGPRDATFNDILFPITRAELMAAVEKRVAGEIRSCLEQHAVASSNRLHRYPWAAPLGTANHQGKAGTRFGRIPESQPGSGPEAALKASIASLRDIQAKLAGATDGGQQLLALNAAANHALQTRNLFDVIFAISNRLKQSADNAGTQLQPLASTINDAMSNGRISRSEGSAIRSLGGNVNPALDVLPELIGQFGIDVFPAELSRRSTSLAGTATPEALITATQSMQDLLAGASTPRSDIAPVLGLTIQAAVSAHNAATASAAEPLNSTLTQAAKTAASDLLDMAGILGATIESSRISVLAADMAEYPQLLTALNTALRQSPGQQARNTLINALETTRFAIEDIAGNSTIADRKKASAEAITAALLAARAPFPNTSLIDTSTSLAIQEINLLVDAISTNELSDNNLGRTSLLAGLTAYQQALNRFSATDTANPRPLQSDIVPYARTLGGAVGLINMWLQAISTNTLLNAPQAKAYPVAITQNPADVSALESSAYTAASNLLNSINGRRGALESVQAYIDKPAADTRAKANSALAETSNLLDTLLSRAEALSATLSASTASALPMVWNSSRCDFLLTGRSTWWNNNLWSLTVFYQISSPVHDAPGTLSIDDTDGLRLVTLAGGHPLAGQIHAISLVGHFLEDINADSSRNGDALAPVSRFTAKPPGSIFNDRLAY